MDINIIIAFVGVALALLGVIINFIRLKSIQKQINMDHLKNAPNLAPNPGASAGDANSGVLWPLSNKGGNGEIIHIENFNHCEAKLKYGLKKKTVYSDEVVLLFIQADEYSRKTGKMFPKFKIYYRTHSGERYSQFFQMGDNQTLYGGLTVREKK